MFQYLMYKKKLYNMEAKRFPKIASNSNQNPSLQLEQGWNKDTQSWIKHCGKRTTSSWRIRIKFKILLKKLEGKRKLRYYKEVINRNLANQNYLFVFTSAKNKMNIANIRTNYHDLLSETGHWLIPKTPQEKRVCHLCDTKKIKDENHSLGLPHSYSHPFSFPKPLPHYQPP